MKNKIKKAFQPKLKLIKGTRFVSLLFIGFSVLIAGAVLFAANMYYNIDTGEVVLEEMYRVAGVIRATAGLIVGGTDSQSPTAGYDFEVVGSARLATTTIATGTLQLIAANQLLTFTGGTGHSVGFRATTTLGATTVYTWPGAYPAASNYLLSSSDAGTLSWADPGDMGLGTITAVGDVGSGAAFTQGTATGTSLWFHRSSQTGKLTIADTLTGDRTYTLPDLTGTVALQSASALTSGGVLFAEAGLISQDAAKLFWATSTERLGIGTNTPGYSLDVAGAIRGTQLRISGAGAGQVVFGAPNMASDTSYTWPSSIAADRVLTTDGSGNLSWSLVEGVGGITGTGQANYLARWTSSTNIATSSVLDNYTGGTALTIGADGNIAIANNLTVSGAGGITAALYTSAATTTIGSGTGDIVLNPATGRVTLASGAYIVTGSGYEIGRAGTEVLREMIPIFGFDLPAQTATTAFVKISRTIQEYPFSSAATGTTRVHRFVIRYTDNLPTASSTDWQVNTTGSGTTSAFFLPGSNDSALESGQATTTGQATIPTDDGWWLEVKSQPDFDDNKIKVFQIFLAAYDQVQ